MGGACSQGQGVLAHEQAKRGCCLVLAACREHTALHSCAERDLAAVCWGHGCACRGRRQGSPCTEQTLTPGEALVAQHKPLWVLSSGPCRA